MNLLQAFEETQVRLPDLYRNETPEQLQHRVRAAKEQLGKKLYIPGHHYQKDEVIAFADSRGDSLKLAQLSAANEEAEHIVFCGVHFMAETADILTKGHQHVYLPDLRAGCSMADMANETQIKEAWGALTKQFGDTILPLTYVNSTASIKSFVGKHGGATVTSSNAHKMVQWAFTQKERILFLPDQHLGRNTAYDLGIPLEKMAVYDPVQRRLTSEGDIEDVNVILWKGHCSVHENFTVRNVEHVRESYPDMKIIVHPECTHEVVQLADQSGSTNAIIQAIEQAPSGSQWAIGTEMNLVNRLIQEHRDKHIISLNPTMCPCLTMNRIDLPHLAWCLDSIIDGKPHNQIVVDEHTSLYAKEALQRMLIQS
ncbi:quinolinate synthetase [Pontibacillus halophilus JSM 076056 = DSM 19796]|uniref:Quinolinate synthase n=1 Tax=Pontibacillus halophilus JSM 076056 = DSM 19796 TaxID=1385510 RepID=A0A0A5GR93_9BACI|nr:quinolinate synthase NadA [Pontibacillus halophilus]KGX93773.1 quinolinate synthetase [Pontibacillus halophilus JSM 076056 = DSM 19796]